MIITSIFFQCKSSKSNSKDITNINIGKEHIKKHDLDSIIKDTLFFHCDNFKGYFDNETQTLSYNGMLEYCLREKAYLGDSMSVAQVAELITKMRHPFGIFHHRLRGKKIFIAVLNRLNNFDFIYDADGRLMPLTFYGNYNHIMKDMIESINGMSASEYVKKIKSNSIVIQNTEESLDYKSPEYLKILNKIDWEIYFEAYSKGLIKLKDFGQE